MGRGQGAGAWTASVLPPREALGSPRGGQGSHEEAGKLFAKLVATVFPQNSSGPEDLSPGP